MTQIDLSRREPPQSTPWYREPLVWMLVLIPGSAVIMGIFAVSLSIISYDGLVVDDYYKRGLEINQELARDEVASAYALAATLDLDGHAGTATAQLQWKEGFIPPQALQFHLYHATRSGLDQEVLLQHLSGNIYRGKFPMLSPGDYHLQLESDDWRLTGTVNAPLGGRVVLTAHASSS